MSKKKQRKNTRQTAKSHEFPGINSLSPITTSVKSFIELFIGPGSLCQFSSVKLLDASIAEDQQQSSEKQRYNYYRIFLCLK